MEAVSARARSDAGTGVEIGVDMSVFQATSYIEFFRLALSCGDGKPLRGSVKAISAFIGCHPTYISQVLRGKAHLNHEQAILFCSHERLEEDEAEYFIDLLNRDRAGSKQAKAHFSRIIERKLSERNSVGKRAKLKPVLRETQEVRYFQSWTHHLVHAALQISGLSKPENLGKHLGLSAQQVLNSLQVLKDLNLAAENKNEWVVTEKSLHIAKSSPLNDSFHSNWRLNTSALLMKGLRTSEHTHFSSVFSIARSDTELIRETLLNTLQEVRGRMLNSRSERLFTLCLDYYPLKGDALT